LRLGSRSLSEGTDWDSQHTLVNLILSVQATEGEPPPSTMAIIRLSALNQDQVGQSLSRSSRLSLYRERLGEYRGESTLYILDYMSLRFTLNRPAFVQAALERCGLHLRPALHGGFLGAKEATYLHTNSPGTELGVSILAYSHVIAYASRTMDPAQMNYTTTQKELLAIEFDLEIRDKKSVENLVVDHLSQIDRGINPLPI
ncbi:hypothetical protein CR513_27918, partial [Mucuna pruriens]